MTSFIGDLVLLGIPTRGVFLAQRIGAVLEQIETGVWHPKMTRLDFQVALNLTGTAVDDPDAMFFENYRCGSQRNFSGYCSEEIDRLMVEQSQTLDRAKRLALVNEIDRKLQRGRREAHRLVLLAGPDASTVVVERVLDVLARNIGLRAVRGDADALHAQLTRDETVNTTVKLRVIARQQQLGILKGQPQEQLSIGFPGPSTWTLIGPQQITVSGQGANFGNPAATGRVNALAIDPTTTTNGSIVAYLATDGGGVWKTTNCCTSNTNWTMLTDDAAISTTAVDTLVIDPNNHNTVYAGTGDLNYGSFSMGSQGILKSIDAGAHWTPVSPDLTRENPGVPANLDPVTAQNAAVHGPIEPEHREGSAPDRARSTPGTPRCSTW